jgi:hypothetical protein
MKIAQIRAMIVLLLTFLQGNKKNPKVKKIALEVRTAIDDLFTDDEDFK